jgi:glycerol-3-phosphate dehydrogenase
MPVYDACVIGAGGVVGTAIVRELSLRGLRTAGIEAHSSPACETSGRNSRVLHSGFHEASGTLKARLTADSCRRIVEFCTAAGVPLLKTGMLIAIPEDALSSGLWREAGQLRHLWMSGRRQHIPFRWILSRAGVKRIAPVCALGGIFIPSVCVVDVLEYILAMQREALRFGGDFFYDCDVTDIDTSNGHFRLRSAAGAEFESRILINSAGLRACDVSRIAGGPTYHVEFIRGEYYELRGGTYRWNIRTLVYPAMPERSRSKGIHFGPRTDGRLYIGPDASTSAAPTPKDVFLRAAQRFVPEITADDLEWAYAGVRPKYTRPDGVSDFLIRVDRLDPLLINLIGIDSPGLSASLGLATFTADMISDRWNSRCISS